MRVKPIILIAIIGAIICVIAGQWFYFKAKFEAQLPQLEARARAAGLELDYQSRSIHGFPFRLEARYNALTISKTDPQLGFALTAPRAVLLRQLLRQDLSLLYLEQPQFAAAAEGPLPGGQTGEHSMAWSAAAMQSSLRSASGALARLSSVIEKPQGQTTLAGIGDFSAEQMQFHLNWPAQGRRAPTKQAVPRMIINTQASGLVLETGETGPLPQSIEKIQLGGTLHLADYYALDPAGLAQWQRDKGFFTLSQFDLKWGDVTINQSTARITLDKDLMLKGAGYVTVTGLPALTYAIDKTDVLGRAEEMTLLTLRLARAGATAETPIKLDLDVDGGVVRLGPAPLVQLGPVAQMRRQAR